MTDETTDARRRYFAYRHISGHIHVKRYDPEFGQENVNAAEDSPFVDYVLAPYEAKDRTEAERIAKEKLSVKEQ